MVVKDNGSLDLQTREWKDEDNLNKLNFLRMQISLLVPNQESWQLGKLILSLNHFFNKFIITCVQKTARS